VFTARYELDIYIYIYIYIIQVISFVWISEQTAITSLYSVN